MADPFKKLSVKDLRFLRKAIASGQLPAPVSGMAIAAAGRAHLQTRIGPLATVGREEALKLLDAALERSGVSNKSGGDGGNGMIGARDPNSPQDTAQLSLGPAPDGSAAPRREKATQGTLVWSGPKPQQARTRATLAVLLDMFGSARSDVLIAGYVFDHGKVLFEPLFSVMKKYGVKVRMFIDVASASSPKTRIDSHLAQRAHWFMEENWPFGPPGPELYYYPAAAEHGSYRSLHAKCVVVDGRRVMVGSANFTDRGCKRNLEVGVCLDDPSLASTIVGQFEALVRKGDLALLPTPDPKRKILPEDLEEEASDATTVVSGSQPHEAMADELMVADEARELFLRIVSRRLPVPVVGEDVEDDSGGVLASPEMQWPEHRVALFLPEQRQGVASMEAARWRCFLYPLAEDGFIELCESLAREE